MVLTLTTLVTLCELVVVCNEVCDDVCDAELSLAAEMASSFSRVAANSA